MSSVSLTYTQQACKVMRQLSDKRCEPAWALAKRCAGAIGARNLPHPTDRDEEWHYTNIADFALDEAWLDCIDALRDIEDVVPDVAMLKLRSSDAHYSPEFTPSPQLLSECVSEVLPTGLTACSMTDAMARFPVVEKFFFVDNSHLHQAHCAENCALRNGGAWVDVAPETSIADTLLVRHTGRIPYHPHSVVRLNHGSSLHCIEQFDEVKNSGNAINYIELHLAPNANLQYALVLNTDNSSGHLTHLHVTLQEGSQATIFAVVLNGNNKVFLTSDITGEQAKCQIYGLTYADKRQNCEINLLQKHHCGRSASDVLYHCAVNDAARTVFSGNVWVAQQAQKTDAYQKNRNLLLSPQAQALSQPRLEIIADDVRCSHGANYTSYDPEQQFYLQSRGIAPAQAQQLIVSGFLQEIVGHFSDEGGRAYLSALVEERLQQSLGQQRTASSCEDR